MPQKRYFITGTDTEVGKTFFTCALIRALKQQKISVFGYKPVAAGCEIIDGQWRNEDALAIIEAMSKPSQQSQSEDLAYSYGKINPFALIEPIAPHIAASNEGKSLSVAQLTGAVDLNANQENVVLVEGAGGWMVPLNGSETFADYVVAEQLEVILVVGMKLGCINHALMTQQAIKNAGLKLVGWVANYIDPKMQEQQANLETLKQRLKCPLVAEIPFIRADQANSAQPQELANNTADLAAKYVRIHDLI